jgi:NitT/TauT family transport system permease protein
MMLKKHPYLYSLLIILLVWTLAHYGLSKSFLPSPLATMIFFAGHLQIIFQHLLMSFFRIFTAIVITVLLGGAVGMFTARSPKVDTWLSPLLYTLYPVPKIAFLPLLMLFLGLGNLSKITLVSLILFFQIAITIRDSVKGVHPSYFLAIKSLGASKRQIYQHVIIPAILPNLFTSLRISVGTSISVLFFAENFATRYGIGYYIMDSWLKLDYNAMFAGIIAISLMGSALFGILDLMETKICKWHQPNTQ